MTMITITIMIRQLCKSIHFIFTFTARLLYSQYKTNYKWIIIHDYSLDISIELQIIKLIKPSLVLRLNSQDATIYKTHIHSYTWGQTLHVQDNFHDIKSNLRKRHRLVVKDGAVHLLLRKREGKKRKKSYKSRAATSCQELRLTSV